MNKPLIVLITLLITNYITAQNTPGLSEINKEDLLKTSEFLRLPSLMEDYPAAKVTTKPAHLLKIVNCKNHNTEDQTYMDQKPFYRHDHLHLPTDKVETFNPGLHEIAVKITYLTAREVADGNYTREKVIE